MLTNARRAKVYREIARAAEKFEQTCDKDSERRGENGVDGFFTCNFVRSRLGGVEANHYFNLMVECEGTLWHQGGDCMGIRILMLCFMAAMIETGDA